MLNKFLKEVIILVVGKQAEEIADLLNNKKHVNEFNIAKKLDITINQTRNILYKLSDYGLVSFIRKKDKRKGWYIYFWTLNIHQSLSLLEKNLKKRLEQLEEQLKSRKEKRFYNCNTCSIEVSEESALLNDFSCPECEEVYELSNNQQIVIELEKAINKIQKEIKLVSIEREIEHEKIEKQKARGIKKSEKEKKAKRDAKRKANKELKEKLKKLTEKSTKKLKKKLKKPVKKLKKSAKKLKKKLKKLTKKPTKKLKKKLKKLTKKPTKSKTKKKK